MLITEKNLSTSVQGIDEARYGHETAKTTVTIPSINVEELLLFNTKRRRSNYRGVQPCRIMMNRILNTL